MKAFRARTRARTRTRTRKRASERDQPPGVWERPHTAGKVNMRVKSAVAEERRGDVELHLLLPIVGLVPIVAEPSFTPQQRVLVVKVGELLVLAHVDA